MKIKDFLYKMFFSNKISKNILTYKPIKNLIRYLAGFLNYYLIREFKINNLKFKFNLKDSKNILFNGDFYLGLYEKEERYFCEKYLKINDNVLEIGGGYGIISNIIKNKIKNGKLLIIEANSQNIPFIEKNLKINKFKVEVKNIFISNLKGRTKFYINESFLQSSSKVKNSKFNLVENKSLDSIFKEYKYVFNVLVIDIEGAEIELFNENLELIKKYISKIIIELHPGIIENKEIDQLIKNIQKYYKLVEYINEVYYFTLN